MSVAFTKDEDHEAAAANLPDRPISPHPNLVTAELLHSMDMSLEGMSEQTPPPQGREEVPWGNSPTKHKIRRQTQVTKKSFQWQGCGFHIWYMIGHARTVT